MSLSFCIIYRYKCTLKARVHDPSSIDLSMRASTTYMHHFYSRLLFHIGHTHSIKYQYIYKHRALKNIISQHRVFYDCAEWL